MHIHLHHRIHLYSSNDAFDLVKRIVKRYTNWNLTYTTIPTDLSRWYTCHHMMVSSQSLTTAAEEKTLLTPRHCSYLHFFPRSFHLLLNCLQFCYLLTYLVSSQLVMSTHVMYLPALHIFGSAIDQLLLPE